MARGIWPRGLSKAEAEQRFQESGAAAGHWRKVDEQPMPTPAHRGGGICQGCDKPAGSTPPITCATVWVHLEAIGRRVIDEAYGFRNNAREHALTASGMEYDARRARDRAQLYALAAAGCWVSCVLMAWRIARWPR